MATLRGARARVHEQRERLEEQLELLREEPAHRALVRGRLMAPYRRRQFGAFGAHSFVHRPAWIYGAPKIHIGERVAILTGAWLAAERQTWRQPGPAITIGDGSAFRAWVSLSASAGIEIGSDVVFGAGCSVVDSNHTWRNGAPNVLHNPFVAEPITIGSGTWLADRVTVLAGARIGERCAIGAGSVVRGEIPDGSVAVGAPARVVGRSEDL